MKKYNNLRIGMIITIFSLALNQLSCTKEWLEKKPDVTATVPASLKDCQALLDRNELFNANLPVLGEIASDGYFVNDINFSNNLNQDNRNAYTWSNSPQYSTTIDWGTRDVTGSYGRIFTCNLILETLAKIDVNSANEQEYNSIKGQTLFHRAKAFYELAQIYVDPFQLGTDNSGLGLPLRLETDVNVPSLRSTVQQTYDRILQDLSEAESLLPTDLPTYKTRASKVAAYAMLARVYNGMEAYEEAGIVANTALNLQNTLLDFSKLNEAASNPIAILNEEVIFHSTMTSTPAVPIYTRINPELKALYDPNDLRNTIFFGVTSGQIIFKGFYYGGRLCFNGLATDEMYLIRAESYARAGNTVAAMQDINTLLKSRWKKASGVSTYVDRTTVSSEEALNIVLLERRKELLLRGLRWTDLRRLNRDPRFATTITRMVNGKTYTLEPGSFKYTFPLPLDVLDRGGMPQNIGW